MNRYVLLVWNILLSVVLAGLWARILGLEQELITSFVDMGVRIDNLGRFIDVNYRFIFDIQCLVNDIHVSGGC